MAEALAIGGKAVQGVGTILSANSQAKALRKQADQLDIQAGQERASSQRQSMEEQRQARLAMSRGLAVAAASGGGASDPTVVNALANLAGEGEFRALTALYNGDQQALSTEADATARRKEAKNVKRAGLIQGIGTLLQAGSTMQERYG